MRKILVLQHVPYERQGYIADYMEEHDIDFDIVRLDEERLHQEARDLAPLMKAQCYRLLDNFFVQEATSARSPADPI